jgi:hypothetical protein
VIAGGPPVASLTRELLEALRFLDGKSLDDLKA